MTDKPPIHEALAAVMAQVRAVGKGEHNRELGFRFRGIDAVLNAVGPVLRDHGIVPLPQVLDVAYRDVRTSRDKPAREVTVRVRYRFVGPAGDHLDVEVPGEAMDHGDKGTAKAMSVAMRIALLQALCLPTDDADPDTSHYERAEHAEQAEQPTAENSKAILRGTIKRVGERQGRTIEWLTEDFAKRTNGTHISAGSAAELQAYLAWLEKQPDIWTTEAP